MKKTDELKREINAKRQEVDRLQREEQMDAALKAAKELNAMCDELEIAKSLEASDFEKFAQQAKFNAAPEPTDKAVLLNRAFNKLVFNLGGLTDAEREAYYNVTNEQGQSGSPGQIEAVPNRGGYLVLPEQSAKLQEFREDYVQLRDYVTVVQTESTSGSWPVLPHQKLEFQSFAELTDIVETDVTFSQATFSISDKGLIIPISQQLVDDADVDIIDVIGRQLAEGAVYTENKEILEPLTDLVTASDTTTIASYKTLDTAMFKTLDGVYFGNADIYTNQDGALYLMGLEDGNNRPLMQPDITQPNTFRYRGKPVVVIPNSTLPNSGSGANTYAPFFVGDMREYLHFFERAGMWLDMSRELYFRKYALAIRAVIRFGITVYNPYAMVPLKVKI